MPALCPIPPRASVRDLLADLLGHAVRVQEGQLQTLTEERPAYAAVYRRDEGHPGAVGIFDLALASASGAAIGMVSSAAAESQVKEHGGLEGDLLEFFQEVSNVLAKLLNSPTTPHVVMREVHAVPGKVPKDVADLVLEPVGRADYQVQVDGFPAGLLTLLIA